MVYRYIHLVIQILPNHMKNIFLHYTFIISVLFISLNITANAQLASSSSSETISNDKTDSPYPESVGRVNDFENILTKKQEHSLTRLINSFEKETTIEIAILTLDPSLTSLENFDAYSLSVMNYWGVGKKETNNGILIAVSAEMRRIRINNGYGIEKVLSDEQTKVIINNFCIPHFKKNEYFEGIKAGLEQLIEHLKKH